MLNVTCNLYLIIVFMYVGGNTYDEILEFRPDTEEWSLAGRMVQARGNHAVSTINFEDVSKYCN